MFSEQVTLDFETGTIYEVDVVENRKLLNDAVSGLVGWLAKHRMRRLAIFILATYKRIFGEYKTYRVKSCKKVVGEDV